MNSHNPVEDSSNANTQAPNVQAVLVSNGLSSPTPTSSNSIKSVSTATWEREQQEAEELFYQKVEKLSQNLWPTPTSLKRRVTGWLHTVKGFRSFIPAPQALLVEHLRGGDLNHITSITIPWLSEAEGRERDLILRVPRWDQHRIEREVAILDFVRQKSTIPVPIVIKTDFTCQNALGKPFVLQRRVTGSSLNTIWSDLSHSQRCTIAKQLGTIVRSLMCVESPIAGLIEAKTEGAMQKDAFKIIPFEIGDQNGDEDTNENRLEANPKLTVPYDIQHTLDLFQFQFGRWRTIALAANDGETDSEVELWDSMLKAVQEMGALGLFEKKPNCLCHVDLHPGNIIALVNPNGTIKITSILDWDEAIIAPKFMACMPLAWIWDDTVFAEHRYDEEGLDPWPYELDGANAVPSTLEKQELKQVFDEHAGPEYRHLAYDESYRLCRGLFRIAKEGLNDNQSWKAAERILGEWECLRRSLIANSEDQD